MQCARSAMTQRQRIAQGEVGSCRCQTRPPYRCSKERQRAFVRRHPTGALGGRHHELAPMPLAVNRGREHLGERTPQTMPVVAHEHS